MDFEEKYKKNLERYGEAYKNALEILKKYHNSSTTFIEAKTDIENAFPELKEFTDEDIRKALIDGFTAMKNSKNYGNTFSKYNIPITNILDWLERSKNTKI